MRLVPGKHAPRALSIIFSGVSLATIFAAPFGSYVGDLAGWRAVFVIAAGLGVLALAAQFATLPSLPSHGQANPRTLIDVVTGPRIAPGMIAIILMITGHFALFTYIRPFLETVTRVGASGMSEILLAFGAADFFDALLGGFLRERDTRLTLLAMPLAIDALALAIGGFGSAPLAAAIMIALSGLAFGAVPVAWSTWITHAVPDEAESAGGLLVAAFQLRIATGGLVFDASGPRGVCTAAGVVLLVATLVVLAGVRSQPTPAAT
jgi:predicted MFS family arabinose efflux permease